MKKSPKFKNKTFRNSFLNTFTSGFDYKKINKGDHNRIFSNIKRYTKKIKAD